MDAPELIVAIDVGNTRAKFGLFRSLGERDLAPTHISACVLRQTTSLAFAFRQWWKTLNAHVPEYAMIAGSHPESCDRLVGEWPLEGCQPIVISGYQQIPIEVDVEVPGRVGVDRLLNVFAAGRMLRGDQPVIVVDSGTATTVDLMTSDSIFRGGSILPGLRLSAHAMHDYTARLPLLNVDDELAALPDVPGRNTEAAMRAGLFIGQLGAVRELVSRLSLAAAEQFRESVAAQVFVTGGGGRQLASHLTQATYVDSLPLHGLAMLCPNF